MRRLALVLLAGCWTGAAPLAESPEPRDAAAPRARPPLEIGLERGPCLGRCPEFELTIADDGHVRWWGKRNVAAIGHRTRRLAPADLDALDRELARARIFDRDENGHLPREPVCVQRGRSRSCSFSSSIVCSDTSHTTLRVRRGDRIHEIDDAHCSDEDAALIELERRIIESAGAATWIGGG